MVGTAPGIEGDEAAGDEAAGDEAARTAGTEPRPSRVLRGPALLVLGLAVLIVVVGLVGAAVSSGHSGRPAVPPAPDQVALPDGTNVSLSPASSALRSLETQGQPPADVLGHLVVPAGRRPARAAAEAHAVGQYDRTAAFSTSLPADEVVDAYRLALARLGWRVTYVGPGVRHGRSGTEVLATRGSADGYEWEVGVVVSPATGNGTTPFSVEVLEVSDIT